MKSWEAVSVYRSRYALEGENSQRLSEELKALGSHCEGPWKYIANTSSASPKPEVCISATSAICAVFGRGALGCFENLERGTKSTPSNPGASTDCSKPLGALERCEGLLRGNENILRGCRSIQSDGPEHDCGCLHSFLETPMAAGSAQSLRKPSTSRH